jgi:hypothetical protein
MTQPTRVLCCVSVTVAALAVSIPALMIVAKRGEHARRAAVEPWREIPDWAGTEISSKASVPVPVRKAFEGDPPAPDQRKQNFASHLAASAPYPCKGWHATIDSVTPEPDGWEVVLSVGISLKSLRGGIPFTNGRTIETWHVSTVGRARYIKSGPSSAGILFVD